MNIVRAAVTIQDPIIRKAKMLTAFFQSVHEAGEIMRDIFEFLNAALPWIIMSLLLAVFFVKLISRKKNNGRYEEYGSAGISIGLCFGFTMSMALHINVGIGMAAGVLFGLLIGSKVEKEGRN